MRTKYWRMRAYSPYFDSRTPGSARLVLQGRDGDLPGRDQARALVPADAQGRKLYIWYDCGGGTCSQFAGDIGVARVPRRRGSPTPSAMYLKGYKGLFVDDVNM